MKNLQKGRIFFFLISDCILSKYARLGDSIGLTVDEFDSRHINKNIDFHCINKRSKYLDKKHCKRVILEQKLRRAGDDKLKFIFKVAYSKPYISQQESVHCLIYCYQVQTFRLQNE